MSDFIFKKQRVELNQARVIEPSIVEDELLLSFLKKLVSTRELKKVEPCRVRYFESSTISFCFDGYTIDVRQYVGGEKINLWSHSSNISLFCGETKNFKASIAFISENLGVELREEKIREKRESERLKREEARLEEIKKFIEGAK